MMRRALAFLSVVAVVAAVAFTAGRTWSFAALVAILPFAAGWAAAMADANWQLALYPAFLACALAAVGGLGAVAACGGWCAAWWSAGRLFGRDWWRLAVAVAAMFLFFSLFWVKYFWPEGGWGIAVSLWGSPVPTAARAFMEHGGSYDPRVSDLLYTRWYGTDYPMLPPDSRWFGMAYAAVAGVLWGVREGAERFLRQKGEEAGDAVSGEVP